MSRDIKHKAAWAANGGSRGFSLVELMIVMTITVFVLAATSQILVSLISNFKQQGKIAESSIERVVGLEILRRDIQSAGFGLASGLKNSISIYQEADDWSKLSHYTEATNPSGSDPHPSYIKPADFNDSNPQTAPRAFIITTPTWSFNDSNYIVIKSANLGSTAAAGKFHILRYDHILDEGVVNAWYPKNNNPLTDANLIPDDYVMALTIRDKEWIGLVNAAGDKTKYYARFKDVDIFTPPNDRKSVHLIYGLSSDKVPVAPFNRADYFISDYAEIVPADCAPGTGVLVKASMLHGDGKLGNEQPLLDCVADIQVVFTLDENGDGNISPINSIGHLSAKEIKEQLKQVSLYILVQEGRANARRKFYPDPADESVTTINVGMLDKYGDLIYGRAFDLNEHVGSTFNNYKWRVMQLTESPSALR